LEKRNKERLRKLIRWLLVDLAVACFILALLVHRPSQYKPVSPLPTDPNRKPVPHYFTHDLSPALYNGAQIRKPFELVVDEKLFNEAIAGLKWPQESQGVTFSAPVVLFTPGTITLMSTANIEGAGFIITVVLAPRIDPNGLLNVEVEKVRIGAMNITFIAKLIAKKMYQDRLETVPVDTETIGGKISAALFNDEPVEPVFMVDDKKVRIDKITITQGKLTARIVPAS
jgi:hypothetical protein